MKVSTAKENARSSDASSKVMIFYCGPADNKARMTEIGRNLLQQIPYFNRSGVMPFKSDEQTAEGTIATGIVGVQEWDGYSNGDGYQGI